MCYSKISFQEFKFLSTKLLNEDEINCYLLIVTQLIKITISILKSLQVELLYQLKEIPKVEISTPALFGSVPFL